MNSNWFNSASKSFYRRGAEAQRRRENIKTAFAAKNAKSANKIFIMAFNLRIFATLAAEKYFFSVPQRLCG
jgi:hypothetical protein